MLWREVVCCEMRSILNSEFPHMCCLRPGDRTTADALSPNYIGNQFVNQEICSWWKPGSSTFRRGTAGIGTQHMCRDDVPEVGHDHNQNTCPFLVERARTLFMDKMKHGQSKQLESPPPRERRSGQYRKWTRPGSQQRNRMPFRKE